MDSAVAGLRAHQNKLDVIGHNIANVNTFGYKSQNYSFQEAMYQTSSSSTAGSQTAGGTNAAQYGYGSLTGSISMDMTASTPTYLGGFNASISGEGFFITYASPDAQVDMNNIKGTNFDYTRVGQFLIDSNGYMVDSSGNFVYGYSVTKQADNTSGAEYNKATLAPIQVLPAGATLTDIKINKMGEITGTYKTVPAGGGNIPGSNVAAKAGDTIAIGQVAIMTFQNPEGLTKSGGYYYNASGSDNTGNAVAAAPGDTATATLMTGYLEASNVDLAKEFSDMITAQRGFQANTKMITVSDEILNELVNMKR